MKNKKVIFRILAIIFISVFVLFLIRLFSERHLDDVAPNIKCGKELLNKADVLSIIPKFDNISISQNKIWCDYILSLNKRLILHGVYHTYQEFLEDRSQDYINEGSKIFEECFGYKPTEFKPPQLAISKNNKILIKKNYKLDTLLTQITHKVYHCEDTGKFPNWFIDIF